MPSSFAASGNTFLAPHINSRIDVQRRTGRNSSSRVCNVLSALLLSTGLGSCTRAELRKAMGNDPRRADSMINVTISAQCITERADGRIQFFRRPRHGASPAAVARLESDIFTPPKAKEHGHLGNLTLPHNMTGSGAHVRPSNPPPKSVDGGVGAAQARPGGSAGIGPLPEDTDTLCDDIAVLETAPQPAPPAKLPSTGLTSAAEATQAAMAMLNAARQKRGDAPLPPPDAEAPPPAEPEPPEDAGAPPHATQPRQAPADGLTDAQRFQRHLEHMRKGFVPIQGPPEPLTEHACEQVAAIDPALNHPRTAAQWLRRELHQAGVCGQLLQRGMLAYRHQLTKQVIHFPLAYIRKAALNQRALQMEHDANGSGS